MNYKIENCFVLYNQIQIYYKIIISDSESDENVDENNSNNLMSEQINAEELNQDNLKQYKINLKSKFNNLIA